MILELPNDLEEYLSSCQLFFRCRKMSRDEKLAGDERLGADSLQTKARLNLRHGQRAGMREAERAVERRGKAKLGALGDEAKKRIRRKERQDVRDASNPQSR